MGDSSKGAGEDGGTYQGPGNNLQGGSAVVASV